MRSTCPLVVLVSIALFLPCAVAGEPVGWRTDGTGAYPDASVPTAWSRSENVVWHARLKEWSNSTPVLVGEKLFVTAEREQLVCIDATSGEVLWQKDVTFTDLLSKEQQAKAAEQAEARKDIQSRIQAVQKDLRPLQKEWNELRDRLKKTPDDPEIKEKLDATVKDLKDTQKAFHQARREMRKLKDEDEVEAAREEVKTLKDRIDELKKQVQKLSGEIKNSPEAVTIKEQMGALKPRIDELQGQVKKIKNELKGVSDFLPPGTHNVNGYSTHTPVSDGERVYVCFGTGSVAAFDLDGERIWAKWLEKPPGGWGISASPLLAGERLIIPFGSLYGLDPATGDVDWKIGWKRKFGSPVAATVGETPVAVCPGGEIVRAADGEVLAKDLAKLTYNAPVVHDGVAYFIEHGGKAIRLPSEVSDDMTFETLWTTKPQKDRYYGSPLVHEGLIYAVTQKGLLSVIDAADGEVVYEQNLGIGNTVYPSPTLAGPYVLVSSDNGKMVLLEPGREFKKVAENRLTRFRSCPVLRNGHMFIRAYDGVYCIGAK